MKAYLGNFRHLIPLLALLSATVAQAERTFKWVDEQGNIHYGDKVPLQYSDRERKELDEQGRTLKAHEAPSTAAQKAKQERLAAIEAEKNKQDEEQTDYDRSLLATYASEADLQMLRDNRLASLEELIRLTNSRIDSMQERLAGLNEDASDYERRGKPVPEFITHQTDNISKQISRNETFIETKQVEMEGIRQQFAADLARYRELQER